MARGATKYILQNLRRIFPLYVFNISILYQWINVDITLIFSRHILGGLFRQHAQLDLNARMLLATECEGTRHGHGLTHSQAESARVRQRSGDSGRRTHAGPPDVRTTRWLDAHASTKLHRGRSPLRSIGSLILTGICYEFFHDQSSQLIFRLDSVILHFSLLLKNVGFLLFFWRFPDRSMS